MKKKSIYILINSQAGFSLVEIMVTLGILSAALVGSLSAVDSISKVNVESQQLHEHQSLHYLNLIKIQNATFARQIINPDAALTACFSGNAAGCAAIGAARQNVVVDPVLLQQCHSATPDCFFQSSLRYDINCTATLCSSVDFTLTTVPKAGVSDEKVQQSTKKISGVSLPALLFAPKKEVNYSCAPAMGFLMSIDYNTNVAACSPVTGNVDCGNNPLAGIGGAAAVCVALEDATCNYGVHTIGLFQGQSTCTQPVFPPDEDIPLPPGAWVLGAWTDCDGTCQNPNGNQTRSVACLSGGFPVNDCPAPQPPTTQACVATCEQITLYTRQENNCGKCYCRHDLAGADASSCNAYNLNHNDDNLNQCRKQIDNNVIPQMYPGYVIV